MRTLGLGIALVILGLLLTFSNVFGFVLGAPLVTIGVILIAVGLVLGVVHFLTGRGDTRLARRGGRTL